MPENKDHYLARTIMQEGWAEENRVYVFNKISRKSGLTSPRQVCREGNFYTRVINGKLDKIIETLFGSLLETPWPEFIAQFKEGTPAEKFARVTRAHMALLCHVAAFS